MQVQQNKTSSWDSTDSHPSDKNKDVRWMGHSFIPRGSVKLVDDRYFFQIMHPGDTAMAYG